MPSHRLIFPDFHNTANECLRQLNNWLPGPGQESKQAASKAPGRSGASESRSLVHMYLDNRPPAAKLRTGIARDNPPPPPTPPFPPANAWQPGLAHRSCTSDS